MTEPVRNAILSSLFVLAGCGGITVGLINQGDHAPGTDLGLPPPPAETFEPCSRVGHTVERVDSNHDGKIDLLRIRSPSGEEVCRGVDANLDGKIDTWEVVKEGRVVVRAHDSNGDGKVDQHWTWPAGARPSCGVMQPDLDGDGKPDPGTPRYDPCGILNASVALPVAPLGPRQEP